MNDDLIRLKVFLYEFLFSIETILEEEKEEKLHDMNLHKLDVHYINDYNFSVVRFNYFKELSFQIFDILSNF